jgi:hypothetical protein
MKHLTEGELRAYLDGEAVEAEPAQAAHLDSCPDCRSRLEAVASRATWAAATLPAPTPAESSRTPHQALTRLKERQRKDNSLMNTLFSKRFRPAWAALATIAALSVALLFPPVQALASNFLGLFRVQQITILPIDTTRLSEMNGDSTTGKQLSQLMSDSVNVTHKPGKPQLVADAAAASQTAGFTVRLPDSRTDLSQLSVQDGTAFELKVNRERAQALLDEAGHTDLQLPASLDGESISVTVPSSVTALYGDCPKFNPDADNGDNRDFGAGSPGRQYFSCVFLAQIPSPTVNAPADLDVQKLAEIGLQFTGMTAEEAHNYSQTIDWASTLVIPLPRNGASYTQVTVDGVSANLIQRPSDDAPGYALVWVKDGIIYAISGQGSDSQAAIDMANSLK